MRTFQFMSFLSVSALIVGCGISSTPTRSLTGAGGGAVAEAQRISLGLGDMAVQNAASLPSLTLPSGKNLTVGGTLGVTGVSNFNSIINANAGLVGTASNATNTTITNDVASNITVYPTWVTANTGDLPQKVSSSKLSFNPFTGNLSATTFTGALSGTATNAANTTIANDDVLNTTVYPTWVTANTGDLPQKVSSTKLSFNPSTGTLTTTTFAGNATSATVATSAGSANNATNATNTAISNDTTSNITVYPTWVTANTGDLPQKVSSSKLSFNPSTGNLSATTFTGALSGNATSATTASSATTANSATTVTFQGVPSSSGSTCTQGMVAADASWLYICVATDTWRRVAISSF